MRYCLRSCDSFMLHASLESRSVPYCQSFHRNSGENTSARHCLLSVPRQSFEMCALQRTDCKVNCKGEYTMTAPAHLAIPHIRNPGIWYHTVCVASNAETAYVYIVHVIVWHPNHLPLPGPSLYSARFIESEQRKLCIALRKSIYRISRCFCHKLSAPARLQGQAQHPRYRT